MDARRIKRFSQLGVLVLSALAIVGCPSQNSSKQGSYLELSPASETAADVAAAEPAVAVSLEPAMATAVSYEVCAEAADWQRPSEADQTKQVSADPRYQEDLNEEPLKSLSENFWRHQAVSFTTYGLSARMEPIMFSGLWTVADDLWNCYEPETTEQINAGELAETWLISHRITDLQRQGDRYVMTVEPTMTGLQIVQFDRLDDHGDLALDIITTDGQTVDVLSGDWE